MAEIDRRGEAGTHMSVDVAEEGTSGPLPPLVRRFVDRNAPTGPAASRVRLRQEGTMQLKPGRWRPFTAAQEISFERVEFSWRARFPILPLITLRVHDWYSGGEGGLDVRVLGLPLGSMRGGDVSKGEAMRYLAELPWAPQAMVANRELEWRQVDDRTVEVATRLNAERLEVLLHFDPNGDIVASTADARPRDVGGRAVDTPFRGEFSDYAVLDGVRVPTTGEVSWELPEGPFTYFRGRTTDLTPIT